MTSFKGSLPKSTAPTIGLEQADAEHSVQLGLIQAARNALEAGSDESGELMTQLQEYTEMHFMSEQLLLRLSARPNYAAHIAEHERLIGEVSEARTLLESGETATAAQRLAAHEKDILDHILSWDRSI